MPTYFTQYKQLDKATYHRLAADLSDPANDFGRIREKQLWNSYTDRTIAPGKTVTYSYDEKPTTALYIQELTPPGRKSFESLASTIRWEISDCVENLIKPERDRAQPISMFLPLRSVAKRCTVAVTNTGTKPTTARVSFFGLPTSAEIAP